MVLYLKNLFMTETRERFFLFQYKVVSTNYQIVLHVANLPDVSLDHPDVLRKKFDLFGSVEDAQVIKSKHIGNIRHMSSFQTFQSLFQHLLKLTRDTRIVRSRLLIIPTFSENKSKSSFLTKTLTVDLIHHRFPKILLVIFFLRFVIIAGFVAIRTIWYQR